MKKKNWIALGIVTVIALAVAYFGHDFVYEKTLRENKVISQLDIKTFQNSNFGFQLEYPKDMEVETIGMSRNNWEIDTGSGNVSIGLTAKDRFEFNTKDGHYRYNPESNLWLNLTENKEENLCSIEEALGKDTYAYLYDSNQMPNAYPRSYFVVTNKDYAFNINAVCGQEGCTNEEVDIQNEIVWSFSLTDNVKNISCTKGYAPKDWKIYQNEKYEFEFKYPKELFIDVPNNFGGSSGSGITLFNYDLTKIEGGEYSPTRDKGKFKIEVFETLDPQGKSITSPEAFISYVENRNKLTCSEIDAGEQVVTYNDSEESNNYQMFEEGYTCSKNTNYVFVNKYFVTKNGTIQFSLGLDVISGSRVFDEVTSTFKFTR